MFRGPLVSLIAMTLDAGIRCVQLFGEIRPWDAKAVVAAIVDNHIGMLGHVAVDALNFAKLMFMMFVRVVFGQLMTLTAEGVAIGL